MADNSLQGGSDTIRDLDRLGSGIKTQTFQIDFGGASGNAEQLASITNPLPIAASAVNFQFSTVNTSSVQLAAGATFTGAWETALNQPALSLIMTSDQSITVTIQQAIDLAGTQRLPDIVVTSTLGVGLSQSIVLNGNYIRITAKNNGTSTTTTFSLNTAYGSIEPVNNQGQLVTQAPAPTYWTSSAALAAGATVTSTVFDTSNGQAWLTFSAYSITSLTVRFFESSDSVTWVSTDAYSVPNSQSNYAYHKSSARYCYLTFTNIGTSNAGGEGNLTIFVAQSTMASETDIGAIALANANPPSIVENGEAIISTDLQANLRTRNDILQGFLQGRQQDLFVAILIELKLHSELLKQGLNIRDELDSLRSDIDHNFVSPLN